jgi:hypothetical protein
MRREAPVGAEVGLSFREKMRWLENGTALRLEF